MNYPLEGTVLENPIVSLKESDSIPKGTLVNFENFPYSTLMETLQKPVRNPYYRDRNFENYPKGREKVDGRSGRGEEAEAV